MPSDRGLTGREQDTYYITLCRAPSLSSSTPSCLLLSTSVYKLPNIYTYLIYTFLTRTFFVAGQFSLFIPPVKQEAMATATASSSPSSPSSSAGAPSTPALQVNGSPTSAENSGKRAELRMTMLKKLRPYPLRHEWVFWHDRSVESMYKGKEKKRRWKAFDE